MSSYERFVAVAFRALRKLVAEHITQADLAQLLRTDSILPHYMRQKFGVIDLKFAELFERKGDILDRAYDTGLSVENLAEQQWRKLIGRSVIKPDPMKVAKFATANVRLIKSVAARHLVDVQRVIENAIIYGARPERLAEEIEARYGVSESRARLIARDQTLKFHGDLVKDKQTKAGIDRYVWTTSSDERVREMHAELDGTEQSWSEDPVTNPQGDTNCPGRDYQCRCIAYPVFDWVDAEDWYA
jgi:SPP1 gp7 family putative phage head morphogenesis protein